MVPVGTPTLGGYSIAYYLLVSLPGIENRRVVRRDVGGGGDTALTDGSGKEPPALGRQHLVGHAHGAGALAKDRHLKRINSFIWVTNNFH